MITASLRSPEQIQDVWDKCCNIGRNELKTVSPWTEFQSKEDEYALFYALNRIGAITILARGPGRLKSFEPTGPDGTVFLKKMSEASRIKNMGIAITRLGLDPAETVKQLFDLYDRSEIKLADSPDKTLFYRTRVLERVEVESIADDIAQKVKSRLQKLDELVTLIESQQDPTESLRQKFGR